MYADAIKKPWLSQFVDESNRQLRLESEYILDYLDGDISSYTLLDDNLLWRDTSQGIEYWSRLAL